ncbi:MAG: NAD(P)H-hydrate dehydratase [Tannerellaceae bacterium]|jgi:NAD(P)H-hydrate epimerase|nr:NAD(P)H-hydrate dehydratase [Tannerellaceae bacterium]
MIKIFTTEKVKELDRYTIENEPIAAIDLVERASILFVQEFIRRFSKQYRIVVFAGFGNNGADALAVARLLKDESYKVITYLFNTKQHLSPECLENKYRLVDTSATGFYEIVSNFTLPELNGNDIVIDGLFGSGLNKPIEGGFAKLIGHINESGAHVVSIDIPSGLFGEDNRKNNMDAIIRAELTLTFSFPKLAFMLPENEEFAGKWKVLDIGVHPRIISKIKTPYNLISEDDIHKTILPRGKFDHKGLYGHALLIAGSRGKMGASLLASKACLRSGVGLLTVHIPSCGEQILQTASPEAILSFDPHQEYFTTIPDISPYAAIGIGPGLGQRPETAAGLEDLLREARTPLVIDADAINIIASDENLLELIPKRSILTPHPKEFDRLAGHSADGYERLMKAQNLAIEQKLTFILKGAYTAICTPGGNIYFNTAGNPGMATAGSGDVLTGIILGLLAQGYEPETASVISVYLHGVAGDHAAALHSEESMIAGDIIDSLGIAFKQVK